MPATPDDAALARLLDERAIDRLLSDYAEAIDRRRWDDLDAVFSHDAVIDYTASGGRRGTRDEIKTWLAEALASFAVTQHFVTNRRIDVEGDTAAASSCFFNPLGMPGDDAMAWVGGWYHDRLLRTPPGWRIIERVQELAWMHGLGDRRS